MARIIITERALPSEALASVTRSDDQVVTLDYLSGISAQLALEPTTLLDIRQRALALAQRWHLPSTDAENDLTRYCDVSIGSILEIELWYSWCLLLVDLELLRRILAAFAPRQIVVVTFRNYQLVSLLQQLCTTPIHIIKPPLSSRLRHALAKDNRLQTLKRLDLDRHIRLGALAVSPNNLVKPSRPITVLGLLELPGSYYAESLLPVLSHVPDSAILLMDRRHTDRVVSTRTPAIQFSSWMTPHLNKLVSEPPYWQRVFDTLTPLMRATFQDEGVDLWPSIAPRLKHIFTTKFPLVAAEIEASERMLTQLQVESLLLNTDAHHGSRLLTLVGQKLGVPALVVQHGATQAPWGYLPLHADRFAAWGEASRRWMIAGGADPSKIVVTGQPRFDKLTILPPQKGAPLIYQQRVFYCSGHLTLYLSLKIVQYWICLLMLSSRYQG
ncbi:hypothetical protein HC891_00645 [Candidatus Gracilibacteria bacterium]|nr:hypothetical protein [Candidatus Gracilibacteria bacterium]